MPVRGIRGATTARANTREAIIDATQELLAAMVQANGLRAEDITSAIFTLTPDLDASFPAAAARAFGWKAVPLLDLPAPQVAKDLPRCIRILIHWNTERAQDEVQHIYLHQARQLRPDYAAGD